MFNIKRITLTNFRSYAGKHSFDFPKPWGLYYLTGKNKLTPSLGANGAGKSTFLDAITWVLYGRTSRGLKATDILTWHTQAGAQVTIDLQVGNEDYQIKRSQKPNTLSINDKPVDQKELETFIRLNYAAFTHSVLSPQFGTSFFSLSPSDKLTLFSDFMGLDFWLTKADEASKLARQHATTLASLNNEIAVDEGRIAVIKDDIVKLKKAMTEFEQVQRKKLDKLLEEKHLATAEVDKCAKAVRAIKNTNLSKQIADAETKVNDCNYDLEELLESISIGSKKLKDLKERRLEFDHQIERFTKLKKGHCPYCDQEVSEQHAKAYIDHCKLTLMREIIPISVNLELKITQDTKFLVGAKSRLQSADAHLQELKTNDREADRRLQTANHALEKEQILLQSIKQKIQEVRTAENPHNAALAQKREALLKIGGRRDSNKSAAEKVVEEHLAAEYWSKAFKRIRLLIIEQAFQSLEIEVNNCLAQLGMADWSVSFDIERENKSGGITKGFVVLIKGPSNPQPVKWENWSGGETQRLQLAGDLGLANLIMQQAGLRSEIEFYDEPSTHLSPEGMLDLADMLHDRAMNECKRIWIADHAAIASFGDFEGIITARKDDNGSTITSG